MYFFKMSTIITYLYFNIRWKKRKMTLYVFCWLLASQRLFFCWWEYPRNVKHIACWNQLLLRKMDHPPHLLRGQIWGTRITWPPSTPVLAPAERTVNSQAWHGMTRLERVSGPLKFMSELRSGSAPATPSDETTALANREWSLWFT